MSGGAVHTPGTLAELISPSGVCDEEQHLLALGIWAKKNAPALQAHADAMAEALAFAPIPGRGEEMMAFRDRQDKWLATKFTALAAYQATKP